VYGFRMTGGMSASYSEKERIYRVGKTNVMSNLNTMLPLLDLPLHVWMVEQLYDFEQVPTSDGKVKLNAPSGQNDDIVDCLGMGTWVLKGNVRRVRKVGARRY